MAGAAQTGRLAALPAAPPPSAAQTVTVESANASIDVGAANIPILAAKSLDAHSDDPASYPTPLPSHLTIASAVSNGTRIVAIDTSGSVFVSKNSGKKWQAVSAPWPGRAREVKLALPPATATVEVSDGAISENKKKSKPKSLPFELTTDAGTTWTSNDGENWKRK